MGTKILEKEGSNNPALTSIPDYYHKFLDIFNKHIAKGLLPHRPGVNHIIKLRDKNRRPISPLYAHNQEKLPCEKAIMDKLLAKGWIRPSKSPVASSTVFTRKTDGQLRLCVDYQAYVSYQQDNWLTWLPFTEFAHNNTVSAALKITPFFTNYNFHPRIKWVPNVTLRQARGGTLNLSAKAATLTKLDDYLQYKIHYAQDIQREFTNRRRLPTPVFRPSNKVWLLTHYIRTTKPSQKIN